MDIEKLHTILGETTIQIRKGAEIEKEQVGPVEVTHVYAMPHESEARDGLDKHDLHFLTIGVDRAAAERHKNALLSILSDWPEPERLAGGPSYIEVGGVIGDQGAAFCLFALGKTLGLWDIITPEGLGMEGPIAAQMAGSGFIMITGHRA
jgi:hypothetical protein